MRELLPNELPRVGQQVFIRTLDGQTGYFVEQA
jgi:hypothetical protein